MSLFILLALTAGVLVQLGAGYLCSDEKRPHDRSTAVQVQGGILMIAVMATVISWQPLLATAAPQAERGCGMEGFFKIVPALFSSGFTIGAFFVWFTNRARLFDPPGASLPNSDATTQWKTMR